MFEYKCPTCGEALIKEEKTYKCKNGHSFDIAKQGYVNLRVSQKSSKKRHGDDALMINSRRDFLDKGYYAPLKDKIINAIRSNITENAVIADLGCGECYYTDFIQKEFPSAVVCGVDISKQALIAGSKRNGNISLAVASTTDLPIKDNYCDVVISVFAPVNTEEIHRILKPCGVWIKAFPLENHLFELKNLIYDKPYLNEVDREIPSKFTLQNENEVKYNIEIDNNIDLVNLFRMTPYYYKTGIDDQNKVNNCDFLKILLEFAVNTYKTETNLQ